MRECSIENCGNKHVAKGYCDPHYRKMKRTGSALTPNQIRRGNITLEWFMRRVIVELGGCWEWQGYRDKNGYGHLSVAGHMLLAHRVSYRLHVGQIPDGMCVLHSCDNPPCMNPDHFFLGSRGDNNRDRENKQRGNHARGIRCHTAKLTESDVLEIRHSDSPYPELSAKYHVHTSTICAAKNRKTWTHI